MQSIKQSMLRLRKGVAKFGGKKPNKAAIKLPLRDGDIERDDEAYKGHSIGFQKEKERVNVAFSRAKKLLIVCGDKNFFYNFDDQDNKFVEIIDYISEEEECEIIQCDGGKLFERESNS